VNKVLAERDLLPPEAPPRRLSDRAGEIISLAAERIIRARRGGKSVMLAFGAHAIKNGLGPVLAALIRDGWVTHLATNGAGIIHDWELAFLGASSESVRDNIGRGQFGLWEETGRYLNLALLCGAYEGLGYGESVGALIHRDGLTIPAPDELRKAAGDGRADPDRAAAAWDLRRAVEAFHLPSGFLEVRHPFKGYSLQHAAYELGVPLTGHPMIGHDIIYCHPMNSGAAVGRTALRDFLTFAHGVEGLDGGVYLSVGSAVMSPMIFEKSLSMARNLALGKGARLEDYLIVVVDLAESSWDWGKDGEPPAESPAYYLRYGKTFARMGGEMRYLTADNRDFLPALYQRLKG
jgi:hypothetical protein